MAGLRGWTTPLALRRTRALSCRLGRLAAEPLVWDERAIVRSGFGRWQQIL